MGWSELFLCFMMILEFNFESSAEVQECYNYGFLPLESYEMDQDVSDECASEDCIILSSQRIVENQTSNYWCYQNMTAYKVNAVCPKTNNVTVCKNRQVKFLCYSVKSEQCVGQPSGCIREWKDYCKAGDVAMGCIYLSTALPDTSTTADEDRSSTTTATATITTTKTTITTTLTSSTNAADPTCDQASCLSGECFFQDHCYFIMNLSTPALNASEALAVCVDNGSLARGLAVDSAEESVFVQNLVASYGIRQLILTSGNRSVWRGWSSTVDHSLLQPSQMGVPLLNALLFIQASDDGILWVYKEEGSVEISAVVCEREFVWLTVLPELRNCCQALYKAHSCSGIFCCASDPDRQIWFQCSEPGEVVVTKPCRENPTHMAKWVCLNGSFVSEAPDTSTCLCEQACDAWFNGVRYQTCPGKYAYAPCPGHGHGYLRWLCLESGSFEGARPSADLCCGVHRPCRRQDPFLNVWVACPNTTVTRFTECLYTLNQLEASVSWTCEPGGFLGTTPDYSHCKECEFECQAEDAWGTSWRACPGQVARHPCPEQVSGIAKWACGNYSLFINPSPDYSECQPSWLDDIQTMVNDQIQAHVIMKIIHVRMESNFTGLGLGGVLDMTSSVIDLFLSQNPGNGSVESFNNFTASFVEVLNDVSRNISTWNGLLTNRKEKYIQHAIGMTERLAFSLLEVGLVNEALEYNNSWRNNGAGVSLWLAYSSFSMDAELGNCSLHLNLPSSSNSILYAAAGILFPHSLASVALPVGTSKVMNSPMMSITVSDVSSGRPVKQQNISMRISFQHVMRSRYPATTMIGRRLHEGEEPSPIIGSSKCFYFDTREIPGFWSESGCGTSLSAAEETVCECWHLSSFSVLVDLHEYQSNPVLEAFTVVCCSFSIIGLVLTLIILKTLKRKVKVDNDRVLIGINCCLCLLISHMIIATVIDKKYFFISDGTCSAVAGVLHYVLLAAFFWMSVEAYHLYQMIVVVFSQERNYRSHYFIVGYVFPLIPIVLTELTSQVLQARAYGRDEICWLQTDFIWSFDGPVFFLTAVNLLVIIVTMRAAITKKENVSFATWWIWCKGLASLCTLLGVTWLIALVYIDSDLPIAFEYFFVLLNGLQGVYMFIFQCLLNNKVRLEFFRFCHRWFQKEETSFSRKATVVCREIDMDSAKTVGSSLGPLSEFQLEWTRRDCDDKSDVATSNQHVRRFSSIIHKMNSHRAKN